MRHEVEIQANTSEAAQHATMKKIALSVTFFTAPLLAYVFTSMSAL